MYVTYTAYMTTTKNKNLSDIEKLNICVQLLEEIKIDPRLTPAIFDLCNNDHLALYREYLLNEGFSQEETIAISNKLAEAGKHPERQAYNPDGLLVTFPTPVHKQRAIARGTHFEKNPKNAEINVFSPPAQQPASQDAGTAAPTAPADSTAAPDAAKPQLPAQQPQQTVPAAPDEKSQKQQEPAVDTRTPEERKVDAAAIEKMLKTESSKKLFTVEEARQLGFFSKDNKWFDGDGNFVGKSWQIEKAGTYILPI
jgi:hypothetical protein